MTELPTMEEFEKLPEKEQKRLVNLTKPLNRAERRSREKRNRQLQKQERKQNG